MDKPVKIAILGAAGRMGQNLLNCAARNPGVEVVAAVEREGLPCIGQPVPSTTLTYTAAYPEQADVVIDFTFHTASAANLKRAAELKQGYVLGTTGFDAEEKAVIAAAGLVIPIVFAPNMSLGVNLLLDLVKRAAAVLGNDYDAEIIEMHHRLKKDAPSGTALGLAEALAAGRGVKLDDVACYGREGIVGERPIGEIGIHAVRGGSVVGDHTVIFAADEERVEITHKASSREAFASGAVRAAAWLAGKPAGIYTMRHVLGFEPLA